MTTRTRMLLFTALAPLTVPAYFIYLSAINLFGFAFYVVIEATVASILRRPITLTRRQMVLLAIPVLLAAPFATAIHLIVWLIRGAFHILCSIGRWQTATRSTALSFVIGTIWTAAAAWSTVACLNAAMGLALIGQPVKNADAFVHYVMRSEPLGRLPAEFQARRRELIAELSTLREAAHPQWDIVVEYLADDYTRFDELRPSITRRLVDLRWFFWPAELSEDGSEHSVLLLGPLVFVWMLLVRWPGTFAVLRPDAVRLAWFAVRVVAVVWAIYGLITWEPFYYFFAADQLPTKLVLLSPAAWFGMEHRGWYRTEWYMFNAGLWMALIAIVVFVWWLAWRVSPFLGAPRYYIAYMAARLLQRKRIAFFSVVAVTLCVAMMIIVISVMGGFVDSIRDRAHGLLGDLVMDGGLTGFPFYDEFIQHIGRLKDDRTGQPLIETATPLIHTYSVLQFPENKRTIAVAVWGIRLADYVKVNEFGKDLFYDKRFGGTVLSQPTSMPVYGFDEKGVPVLPPEMESRFRQWLDGLPPDERAEVERRFQREPGDLAFPGPGVFKRALGEKPKPGYEGRPYDGIILGRDTIFERRPSGDYLRTPSYPRGAVCTLTLVPLTRGGDMVEQPIKPAFRYIDDSRTGIHDIDSKNVYVDFEQLQELLSMTAAEREAGGKTAARCKQIQIKVNPVFSGDRQALIAVKNRIVNEWDQFRMEVVADDDEQRMMANVDVSTWEEMQQSFISAIEKEKVLVVIMFGVISIVAVFLILCIFYMIVQEKTRDIGILKSLGASAEGVTAVFLAYGAAIGLVGAVLGSLLGITFVEHINDIQDWLARINPDWRVWSPETYSFDKIPDAWKWNEVIAISVLAIVASVLGAAFPATRAGRTWPVESLRYE